LDTLPLLDELQTIARNGLNFTTKPEAGHGPHTAVAIVYLCDVKGGTPQTSHEALEARYWRIEEVPAWHELHQRYAEAAHAVWRVRRAAIHSSGA
jgi:hypothetical protein